MKRSEIYREAARRLIDGGASHGCCVTIAVIAHDNPFDFNCAESEDFTALFRPDHERTAYWGDQWAINRPDSDACRALALCFMAAIAEDEERSARGAGRSPAKAKAK